MLKKWLLNHGFKAEEYFLCITLTDVFQLHKWQILSKHWYWIFEAAFSPTFFFSFQCSWGNYNLLPASLPAVLHPENPAHNGFSHKISWKLHSELQLSRWCTCYILGFHIPGEECQGCLLVHCSLSLGYQVTGNNRSGCPGIAAWIGAILLSMVLCYSYVSLCYYLDPEIFCPTFLRQVITEWCQ